MSQSPRTFSPIRSGVIRSLLFALVVLVAVPATSVGAWMLHRHNLRAKYTPLGLPPDAPIDRWMLELRDSAQKSGTNSASRDYAFHFLAEQLAAQSSGIPRHARKISFKEWLFYCGAPDYFQRMPNGKRQYLYTAKTADYEPTEVLLTVDESDPGNVAETEIRRLPRVFKGHKSTSGDQPFSRFGFVPFSPERDR